MNSSANGTTKITLPPFESTSELVDDNYVTSYIRCQGPYQHSTSPQQTTDNIRGFLRRELQTTLIDELYGRLWLFARKAPDHIDPLHMQLVKRRSVIVVEDSKLHLVWHNDTIYVKPIPAVLLNYGFWEKHLLPTNKSLVTGKQMDVDVNTLEEPILSAIGFLRSYFYLVKHESDFRLAKEAHLLPMDIQYLPFKQFLNNFEYMPREAASPRYHFGQLRQTTLNWAVRLFQPPSAGSLISWSYHQRHWQMTHIFRDIGPPLLGVFAILSLVLSAMQVVLAVAPEDNIGWPSFNRASLGFSVAVLVLNAVVSLLAILGVLVVLLNRLQFSVRQRLR